MRKVLIVTDLYYASPRIPGLCKYITQFGWKATVLTTPLGESPRGRLVIPDRYADIIEVPYKRTIDFWRKLIGLNRDQSILAQLEQKFPSTSETFMEAFLFQLIILGGTLFAYPDEIRSWKQPAIQAGKALLAKERFDAILSSSFPLTSHLVAKELTQISGVPWLADLRDLWTQNHNYLYPKRKRLETQLELQTLSRAKSLTTVSESLSQKLQTRYKDHSIFVIPNGYDADLVNTQTVPLTKDFTITYTGLIYRGKQNPAKLFEALRGLLDSDHLDATRVQVRFYGVIQKWITQLAKQFGLENIVVQYGPILRDDVIIKQRESHVLLLFGWEDAYETGVLPLKMFEYFAARRPILATGGTAYEQFRSIFDNTHAGRYAMDVDGIKKILYEYYSNYLKHSAVPYRGIPEKMDQYTHYEMAQKFSHALNEIRHTKSAQTL